MNQRHNLPEKQNIFTDRWSRSNKWMLVHGHHSVEYESYHLCFKVNFEDAAIEVQDLLRSGKTESAISIATSVSLQQS